MPEPSLSSICADIDAIRAALTRLGAIPPVAAREPRKGVVYVHVYADVNDIVRVYTSEFRAEWIKPLLAVVEVPWREGQGLPQGVEQ